MNKTRIGLKKYLEVSVAFHSLTDFLSMGGYAGYVWTAYGFCLGGFIVNALISRYKNTLIINNIKGYNEAES